MRLFELLAMAAPAGTGQDPQADILNKVFMFVILGAIVIAVLIGLSRKQRKEGAKEKALADSNAVNQSTHQNMSDQSNKSGTAKIIRGVVYLGLGLGIFLWVKEHSPNMGFGEMLTKLDSYIIKQPLYNGILLVCGLLGIIGVILIVQGLQANQKRN